MSDRSGNSRSRWLVHGSAPVLAAALTMAAHSEATAQAIGPRFDNSRSVQADLIVQPPGVTVTTGATQDVITVDNPATILNWTVLDTATLDTTSDFVNFLPQNTAVNFDSSLTDFTVLNRIIPTANGAGQFRGIAINGAVTSTATVSGPPVTAGNIWFYSPGGILIGSGASFNVGSVVLTTSDIQGISGGPRIDFTGVADPMSAVTIQQGANITVPVEGGSAVFFAPTINQGGTVDVNGSVLYMSAEEGSVFDNGVNGFNFFTAFGGEAEPGNGIFHTGTTTGPASQQVLNGLGVPTTPDAHIIDFFAPGANLQLLLEGSIGYQAASVASQDANGVIRLGDSFNAVSSLELGNLTLTSSATIEADSITLTLDQGDSFRSSGDAQGNYNIELVSNNTLITVNPGGEIDILGNLTASRANPNGGTFGVVVNGDPTNAIADGVVSIGGNLEARFGVTAQESSVATDPTPGTVSLTIGDGGIVDVGGDLLLDSSFIAGERVENSGLFSVLEGQGGEVVLTMTSADSQLLVGGTLTADAGARSFASSVDLGAAATGGTVNIDLQDGVVDINTLNADASGQGTGGSTATGRSIDGTGGTVTVNLGNSSADIGSLLADANGEGGFAAPGTVGGAGFGGNARVTNGAGGAFDAGLISISASGDGGGGSTGAAGQPGTTGGEGVGGVAELISDQNIGGISQLTVFANGRGGSGGSPGPGLSGGTGGQGTGGEALIRITSDQEVFNGLADSSFSAGGTGGGGGFGGFATATLEAGDGGAGGAGVGGVATLDIGGTGTIFNFEGPLYPFAAGQGGNGGFGGADNLGGEAGAGGAGGNGTSGISRMIARDGGEIDFTNISGPVRQGAFGGDGGFGGSIAQGSGGTPGTGGDGGVGTGGTFVLSAIGGSFMGGAVPLISEGEGGNGGDGGGNGEFGTVFTGAGPVGNGGNGIGGDLLLETLGAGPGTITFDDLTLTSEGTGGTGTVGGATLGGTVTISDTGTNALGGISIGSLVATVADVGAVGVPSFVANSTSGGIDVAGDFTVNVTGDAVFNFAGDGQLVVGGEVQVDAGQDILVTHIDNNNFVESILSDGSIVMSAGNDFNAGVDTFLSAAGDVDILAGGIGYGFISAGQSAILDSLSGIGGGAIDAGVDIALFAAAGVNVDDLNAVETILIDAGNIAIGDATATTVDFTTGQDILFDSITVDESVTLSALNGTVGTNLNGPGSIDAAANIDIDAANIDVGDLLARGVFGAGQIDLDASGNIGLGSADAQGALNITGGGLIGFAELASALGDITVRATGAIEGAGPGNVTGSQDVTLDGASIGLGTLTVGQRLDVDARVGDATFAAVDLSGFSTINAVGLVSIGDAQTDMSLLVDAGSFTLGGGQFGESLSVDTDAGDINVTGTVTAGQGIRLFARGAGFDTLFTTLESGTSQIQLNADGDIRGESLISGGSVNVDAGNLLIINTINAQNGAFVTGGNGVAVNTIVNGQSGGGFFDIDSGGDITLGSVTTLRGEISAGGDLRIEEELSNTGNFVVSADSVFVRSTGSSFNITARANAGNIDIRGQGDINVEGATATGDIDIRTVGGLVANEIFAFMFASQPLPPGVQTVQQTTSSGGSVTLSGDASLTINAAVDAAAGVELETFGRLTVDASVIGEGITVFADDIAITADGSIGDASRTFSIDFETQGSVTIGGPNNFGDSTYEISSDELPRISSGGRLSISALAASPGDTPSLRVLAADLIAGSNTGNFGQDSVLELISDGSISFSGNLNITGANANTDIVLDALTAVNIELSSGGIFVADANGALAGEVIVNARDFRALSDGTGLDIANATVAEIDMILSNNRGVDRPDGVITADTLTIATTASQVFIQNTAPGTEFEERRGFTVNNLNISTAGVDPQPIVINGIVNGQTGIAAIAPTNITSTVAAGSTINGCAILNTAACTATTPPPPPPPTPPTPTPPPTGGPTPTPSPDPSPEGEIPVRDIIEEEVRDPEEEGENGSGTLDRPLIDMEGLDDPAGAPLIDDPVTGAGNEDLWEPAE
ncbi:beta strand repeat-containing protein [Qipengyuania sp. DGS5-3]|uniref:beta strand repeat-containing protein n=1 Tax=Qipengyuania sp. DGS5-3 TaxID=3349632 RepID=UPI0036D20BD6